MCIDYARITKLESAIREQADRLNNDVFYMSKKDYEWMKKKVKTILSEIQHLLPEDKPIEEIIGKIYAITRKKSCLRTVFLYHGYLKILTRLLHSVSEVNKVG